MNFISKCMYRIKDYVLLNRAIDMADNARAKTGQRFYVMPSTDGKLVVMDRKNFRKLKQKNYIPRKANVDNLIMESFYFTSYGDGTGKLTKSFFNKKTESYYSWCDAIREMKARKKRAEKEAQKKNLKTEKDGKEKTGLNRNSNAHN